MRSQCQGCKFYQLVEVPDFPDLSQTVRVRMCEAGKEDPCRIEEQLVTCPECGSQHPEDVDCEYCLELKYKAAAFAARERDTIRGILEASQ
jgi:hypothetical protein